MYVGSHINGSQFYGIMGKNIKALLAYLGIMLNFVVFILQAYYLLIINFTESLKRYMIVIN